MEEFQHLNWTWDTARSKNEFDQFYNINLGDRKSSHKADPMRCNLLEISPATLQSHNQNSENDGKDKLENCLLLDPRTGKPPPCINCDFNSLSPAISKTLFTQFPEKSHLSVQDHRICLNAIEKFHQSDLQLNDKEDIEHYKKLGDLRREEKATFINCAKHYLEKNVAERTLKIKPHLEEFVLNRWKLSVIKVFRQLSNNWYRLQAGLPLTPSTSSKIRAHRILFEQRGFILRRRKCVRQKFLHKTAQSLLNWYDSSQEYQQMPNIQAECHTIAHDNEVDVVLPLSSLCMLVDTAANCSTNWMMKFHVEDLPEANIFTRKTRITFERPLPPTTMSAVDMQNIAFKYLLCATITPRTDKLYCCKEQTFMGAPSNDIFKEHSSSESHVTKTNTAQYKCYSFDQYLEQTYAKNQDWVAPKGNTVYSVWDLHEDAENESESYQKLRILVTAKQDSFQRETDGPMTIVNYSTKVEFQAEFGAEQMTKSELIREWCRQYFRPNAVTERVRIDVESQRILSSKQLTLSDIERDLDRLYQINSSTLLQPITHIIGLLQKFPRGDFLLRHELKHNNQVMVYMSNNESKSAGLHLPSIYSGIDYQKSWISNTEPTLIDDMEITILHKMAQVMPCAFSSHQNVHQSSKRKRKSKKSDQHNENRIICPKEDRIDILNRIQNDKNTKEQSIKMHRNRKKAEKNKLKSKLRKEKMKTEETLDPYLMFDTHGNVSIAGFVNTNDDLFGSAKDKTDTPIVRLPSKTCATFDKCAKGKTITNESASDENIATDFNDSVEIIPACLATTSKDSLTAVASSSITKENTAFVDKTSAETENVAQCETGINSPVLNKMSGDEVNLSSDNSSRILKKRNVKPTTACPLPNTQTVTRSGRIVKPKFK